MIANKKVCSIVASLFLFSCNYSVSNEVLPRITELFPVKFSGYVKQDLYFDSRQVVGVSRDHFLLFPEPKKFDKKGRDINAKAQFNMVSIESKIRAEVEGPTVLGAQSLGAIEADFFDLLEFFNLFRMRIAYFQLDWEGVSLVTGQYWHPIFVLECYPDTISFNTGDPLDSFARTPQVRLTYHYRSIDIITAASTQASQLSDGPRGFSSEYMRNAIVPNLHAQLQARIGDHVFGFGGDFKRLVPRVVSDKNIKVDESINSFSAIAYAAFQGENYSIRTKFVFSQNGTDYAMISGYAVSCRNPFTDEQEYTNLNNIALWLDADYNYNDKLEPGIFIGYTKNLGASKDIIPTKPDPEDPDKRVPLFFTFGRVDIDQMTDYVFRISPRLRWHVKPVVFGAELEYTRAAFGTINTKGEVDNPCAVGNIRLLLAAYYFF